MKKSYKELFYEINPELYELIKLYSYKIREDSNYFDVVERMGGYKVREDIENIYEKAQDSNDKYAYAKGVIDYFRNNKDKHEDWIAKLKFYTL